MSRRHGLIIGINQYQDPAFRPLQFAENDARALAQWLVNDKGGKWSPPDVQQVRGQYATRELVESLVSQMCLNQAEAGDLVFIYFAGHAFVDERSGEGYLALANTSFQNPATAIHLQALARYMMARSRSSHVLFILDCFQNGSAWMMRRTSAYDFRPLFNLATQNAVQQQSDRLFLCTCRGNEQAAEASENNLGLFVRNAIVGLCGPASDPATGAITLSSLYSYLFGTLGEQQKPQLMGKPQLPLFLIGGPPATPGNLQPPQAAPASPAAPVAPADPPGPGGSLLRGYNSPQAPQFAGAATAMAQSAPLPAPPFAPPTSPPARPEPNTSGQLPTPSVNAPYLQNPQHQQNQQMLAQAQQLLQVQNYPEAFAIVEHILQMTPDDSAALTFKGQLLGTAGRYQEAMGTIEQLVQLEPNNALAWSMRAVVLTNLGYYQDALSSIERSLELDPRNAESYSIKTNIMGQRAAANNQQSSQNPNAMLQEEQQKRDRPLSFLIATGLQFAGLILGIAGAAVLMLIPNLPNAIGLILMSLALALLSVNAARGAFRYGFGRFVLTLLTSIVLAAIVGLAYKFGLTRIYATLQSHPTFLQPVLFLAGWLIIAAVVPLLATIGGLIGGMVARGRAG